MASKEIFSFLDFIGTKVEASTKEGAVLFIDLEKHHLQHLDFVHGGVISTLADNTGWFVLEPYLETHQTAVTQELTVNYLRPAKGRQIRCVGSLVKKGRHSAFVKTELFCDETLVAFSTSHLAILDKK